MYTFGGKAEVAWRGKDVTIWREFWGNLVFTKWEIFYEAEINLNGQSDIVFVGRADVI